VGAARVLSWGYGGGHIWEVQRGTPVEDRRLRVEFDFGNYSQAFGIVVRSRPPINVSLVKPGDPERSFEHVSAELQRLGAAQNHFERTLRWRSLNWTPSYQNECLVDVFRLDFAVDEPTHRCLQLRFLSNDRRRLETTCWTFTREVGEGTISLAEILD